MPHNKKNLIGNHVTTSNHYGTTGYTTTGGQWQQNTSGGKYWQHIYTDQNTKPYAPRPNPLPDSPPAPPLPVVREVEVLVMECPKCEEIKRVEDDFLKGDYICKECRGVG